jgi:hypothetical protein
MTVDQERAVGEEIIALLNLKPVVGDKWKYKTSGGTKTAVGLCRTIQRVFDTKGAV